MLAQSTMKRLIRIKVLFRKQPLFNKPRRNNNAVAVVPCFFLYRSQKAVRSIDTAKIFKIYLRIGVCSAAVLRRRPYAHVNSVIFRQVYLYALFEFERIACPSIRYCHCAKFIAPQVGRALLHGSPGHVGSVRRLHVAQSLPGTLFY